MRCIFLSMMACIFSVDAQPMIVADVSGNITAQANDMLVSAGTSGPQVSIRQLAADVAALKNMTASLMNTTSALPTTSDVVSLVDAAAAGVLNDVRRMLNQSISPVVQRIAVNEAALQGLPQTRQVVNRLAIDVNYLLEHAQNVSACASDGSVHAGNGVCVEPVPQCPRPPTPSGGSMVLSNQYIIPGTTASYSCSGANTFVAGPSVRVCNHTSQQFDGPEPRCLVCGVTNCLECIGSTTTCARCATGYDLNASRSQCVARLDTVIIMGGQYERSRHNHNQVQALLPNAVGWTLFRPYPRMSASRGALAIIAGDMYLVGAGGHGSLNGFWKLPRGGTAWQTFSGVNGFNGQATFYCTVDGVGRQQDGFYMFGTSSAAVYQPAVDPSRWVRLPAFTDSSTSRNYGATAVVGDTIYMLGGYARNAGTRVTSVVTLFNTTSRTFSTGVPMSSGRQSHAATSYNGRVYVFGGMSADGNPLRTVEEFNPVTGQWTVKANMPEAWRLMSTGPMPVFADGTVLIPFAYKESGIGSQTSMLYSVTNNTWMAGPVPPIRLGVYAVAQGSLS